MKKTNKKPPLMLDCDTFWNETNICEQRSDKMRNKKGRKKNISLD